ncbi:putative sulfoacetate transporter SauU [Candidatus Nitrosocosmicus oleophilus]|uniref:Putative sulfoacetate transporter SauU n=1 Tax=Candidatus Nitrosocosmicus oleophilus TaxID=1353260 RepID=A0A654LYS4_9ARCH|nr:MFS transporter [Candidatus Nitrosocosmicus oleophilus]ALI35586.1 putative sulfoacetate transporter SauU [Candidatus Nitrosocosmicus oleophilus]
MSSLKQVFSLPVASIILARTIYAVNWFNISSIFYLILDDFRQDVSMLGLVTSGFLIGIGLFQIPAGILSAKYDAKFMIFFGTMLLSISSLLSGLSSELYQIVILRFLVGVGMAFFFGPSVILISKYLGKGSSGLGVGILNSAHSLGGIIGIFGWIIIAEALGWRTSLVISGTLGILSGLFLLYALQIKYYDRTSNLSSHSFKEKVFIFFRFFNLNRENRDQKAKFTINFDDLKSIMLNKHMIYVGLSLLGFQIAWNLVSTFIILFLKVELDIASSIAGLIGGSTMIVNVIFAPFIGRIYDKLTRKNNFNNDILLLLICGIVISANIICLSLLNIYLLIPSILIIGIFISGGFVIPYALARRIALEKLGLPKYEILAVSFVNGLSLLGAFWVPFVFSIVVKSFGYSLAWLFGGTLVLVFIIPIIKLRS